MPTDKRTVEAALLIAGKEAQKGVHEEGGNNRGKRVEEYLKTAGLGPGNPWCASFILWSLRMAGYPKGPLGGVGAVRYWYRWAEGHGRLFKGGQWAKRGMLFCWLNPDQTGHIGWVAETKKAGPAWWIRTVEGNSNEGGSREGDRVLSKWRLVTGKYRFIDLTNA